jgi:hypothetical protein
MISSRGVAKKRRRREAAELSTKSSRSVALTTRSLPQSNPSEVLRNAGPVERTGVCAAISMSVTGWSRDSTTVAIQTGLRRIVRRRGVSVAVTEFGVGAMVSLAAMLLGRGCELHGGQCNQRGCDRENSLLHRCSPLSQRLRKARRLTCCAAFKGDTDGPRRLLWSPTSRCGEQIFWSKRISAKYSAHARTRPRRLPSSSPTASDAGRRCASIPLRWSPDSWPPHSPGSIR